MGQKVNPHGLRVGVIKDWDSRWFAKDDAFGDILVEDYKLRKFLKKTLYDAGIPRIEIERDATKVRIHIHCSRPGIVIGRGGAEIEKIRRQCDEMINKGKAAADKRQVFINVVAVIGQPCLFLSCPKRYSVPFRRRLMFSRCINAPSPLSSSAKSRSKPKGLPVKWSTATVKMGKST